MVLMTMIGRVADGLPLAASVHNDMRDEVRTHSFIILCSIFDVCSRVAVELNIKIKQKIFFDV